MCREKNYFTFYFSRVTKNWRKDTYLPKSLKKVWEFPKNKKRHVCFCV